MIELISVTNNNVKHFAAVGITVAELPVKDLGTGKIEMTSQNHSYAVDAASLADTPLRITHLNLLDQTVEGLACPEDMVFSVQYHPESAPGPQDSGYLFDQFLTKMREVRGDAQENRY